ncbi:copper transporter [Nocardioides sp. AE5]|uniref:copper transporter n=1 Tax=Nocardioides sp. AE5 TaxID=2962573 RepID=UPI00288227E0|nr:copper transporter [Nocardioides sp. AE5]MDT0201550.1 copper transporter [Nocardioides sp. AE5]
MISFRYHVVTIVAVFLALAVGVALGGGPLSEFGRSSDEANERVSAENEKLTKDLDRIQQVTEFQEAFGNAVVPADLSGVLADTRVAIVTMPGASSAVVEGLTEQINRAEGVVAGTYAIQPALIGADNKPLVDTLGSQLLETLASPGVADGATTYVRMGGLISRAIATGDDERGVDEDATSVRSSLTGAEMFTVTSGGDARADVIVVVLGSEPPSDDGSDKLLASLFAGMATTSKAVVVAGTTDTGSTGILKVLRENAEFTEAASSVDSVQSRTGQVVAAYALGRMQDGNTGQFGANGEDGPLPRG